MLIDGDGVRTTGGDARADEHNRGFSRELKGGARCSVVGPYAHLGDPPGGTDADNRSAWLATHARRREEGCAE